MHLFSPDQSRKWLWSHASTPFGTSIDPNRSWLYFTSRDQANHSHIGRLVVHPESLTIENTEPELILCPGSAGNFDECGVSMGCVIEDKLYYMGWGQKEGVPFCNAIGMALWNGQAWKKIDRAPILGLSDENPYSLSYPFVLKEAGIYRMWYGSHLQWNPMRHVIKYAESKNGIDWIVDGTISIPLTHPAELGVSRPFILRCASGYRMYYSYRTEHQRYRVGLATSVDGISWTRKDHQIDLEGCYPAVMGKWLLYCDPQYGKQGCFACLLDCKSID